MISNSAKQAKRINELKEENSKLKSKIMSLTKTKSKKNISNKTYNTSTILGEFEHNSYDSLINEFFNAFSEAEISVVITNLSGHIIFTNKEFLKLTGYTKEEILNQHTKILKSGRHSPKFYKNLWKTVLSGNVWSGQMINKKKDRTLYTEELTIVPIKNIKSKISYFLAIKKDIVPQKTDQMNNLLRKKSSQKLASEILNDISKPTKYLNYNLCFLKDAFFDLHPLLEDYELRLEKYGDKKLIDISDFNFIKSEISTAIDEALKGLYKISSIEHKLIDIIRKVS